MKVEVFNVGQGDSFLLRPAGCIFSKFNLLVDAGPRKAKVAARLPDDSYNLMLTHSHHDHIGGFPDLFRHKKIESLYIPYYLPEIIRIYQFLQKKITRNYGTLDWRKVRKIKEVRVVGEGDRLCNHLFILNPPKLPSEYFPELANGEVEGDIEQAIGILREFGFELPIDEIINYQTPLVDIEIFDLQGYQELARVFVHQFFIRLSNRVVENSFRSAAYYADVLLELTSNQASIVFKYQSRPGDRGWLFTGDADQSVFNRIIENCPDHHAHMENCGCEKLSATFLKVPHHGSRENLSSHILKYVAPEVAVISHDNRRFGRSLDKHPHHEVIELLDQNNVRTYYTNHVIKQGIVIKNSTFGIVEGGAIEFK